MKNNIRWYRSLYLGEKAGMQKNIWKKLQGGLHSRLHLLVLPSNKANLLDILP